MDDNLAYLKNSLDKEIRNKEEFVGSGNCKNFDEYQRVVGAIQTLKLTCQQIEDLQKRMELKDD
jgi:hypothetical protein